jgi:hypothetical protein
MPKLSSWGSDGGTVTAELVAVLPVMVMLIGLLAVVGAGQLQRVALVVSAAQAARALAVGEAVAAPPGTKVQRVSGPPGEEGEVCASASTGLNVLGFGQLELSEESCTRELGR